MGLVLIVVCIIAVCTAITFFIIVSRKKYPKRSAIIGICGTFLISIGVYTISDILRPCTDLSDLYINGYHLGQYLSDDALNREMLFVERDGERVIYQIANTNAVYLRMNSSVICEIDAYSLDYFHPGQNESLYLESSYLDSLTVGDSSFSDVVGRFGNDWRRCFFIDGYEKRVSYFDAKRRVELVLSFSDDVLQQIKLIDK